jgi:DNA-binding transcriptional LysR family regulator
MKPTLDDLRIYALVCERGSLTAAARELGCTQPAVSQHVRRLEHQAGSPLLERRRRGVTPTVAGAALARAAQEGLGALEEGFLALRRLREGHTGSLTIATGGTTVRHFLREATRSFLRRHAGLTLHFEPVASSSACFDALRAHRAELAFVTCLEAPRGLEQRAVIEMQSMLIVASNDPLAKKRRLDVGQLAGIRYISLSASTSSARQLQHLLAQQGAMPEVVATVDDFDTAYLFVELGLGHSIVPAVHAHSFAREKRVAAIPIRGAAFRVGWAARGFSRLSPPARSFLAAFERSLRQWRSVPGVKVIESRGQDRGNA